MTEPLSKDQLDAFRRAISVARVAQTGVTLKHNEAAALLAHIAADPQDSPDWHEMHQKRVARNGNGRGEGGNRDTA